ncbi:hypothetical protein ACFL2V_19060 [Pseudomonadota bacterium]
MTQRRKNILRIVGISALALNLLLPGLAYSQTDQTLDVDIGCGSLDLSLFADSFEMATGEVTTTATYTFGSAIGDDPGPLTSPYQSGTTALPDEAMLSFSDYRTDTTGCATEATNNDGFQIDVQATDPTDPIGPKSLSSNNFYIVTASNFDAAGGGISGTHTLYTGSTEKYELYYPNGYGDPQDINLPYNLDSTKDLTLRTNFTQSTNQLGSGGTTIVSNTGTDTYNEGTFYTSIAYELHFVNSTTEPGNYDSTVTFSISPAD